MTNSLSIKAILESLVDQELAEANPFGYLSKTAKPPRSVQWDPGAQKDWAGKQAFKQQGLRDESDLVVKISLALDSATPEQLGLIANILDLGSAKTAAPTTKGQTTTA